MVLFPCQDDMFGSCFLLAVSAVICHDFTLLTIYESCLPRTRAASCADNDDNDTGKLLMNE